MREIKLPTTPNPIMIGLVKRPPRTATPTNRFNETRQNLCFRGINGKISLIRFISIEIVELNTKSQLVIMNSLQETENGL